MLELDGDVYSNVDFVSPLYAFDDLCEAEYLTGVLFELRRVMGSAFDAHRFVIFSGPDSNDLDPGANPDRTVVLHISDEAASVPARLCARVAAVFKSYLPDGELPGNLHPLPLGYVASVPENTPVPVGEREQTVFFSGNLNANRIEMFRALATPRLAPVRLPAGVLMRLNPSLRCDRAVPGGHIRFTRGFRAGLPPDEYAWHLIHSKVALCPRGWESPETFRHFEAMRAGAIIVSEELPSLPIYAGSPIITLESWFDARRVLRDLLGDRDRLVELQRRTLTWWRDVCSEEATAATIAQAIS